MAKVASTKTTGSLPSSKKVTPKESTVSRTTSKGKTTAEKQPTAAKASLKKAAKKTAIKKSVVSGSSSPAAKQISKKTAIKRLVTEMRAKPTSKAAVKKTAASKKSAPLKKAGSTKNIAASKKIAAVKKNAPAKKAVTKNQGIPKKISASPAKKSVPSKKVTPAKPIPAAKKLIPKKPTSIAAKTPAKKVTVKKTASKKTTVKNTASKKTAVKAIIPAKTTVRKPSAPAKRQNSAVKKSSPAKVATKKDRKLKAGPKADTEKLPKHTPIEHTPPTDKVSNVLVTLPHPETSKSPYFELAKKFNLNLDFHPFILVEGVEGREFRKQKVDIAQYTAIVFTSRHAVDHFFRLCEELKVKVSQDMKYVCITEAIALYLQKFILYRKRKVFFSPDGRIKGMQDIITKHKQEKYLLPTTDSGRDSFIQHFNKLNTPFAEVTMYKTVANDIAGIMKSTFDMMLFFSPFSIQTLFENNPKFQQKGTLIGAFGPSTSKAIEDAGLRLDVKAPEINAPSMVSAIEQFLSSRKKK